jgi:7-cyano-7-deazaguanine synthase
MGKKAVCIISGGMDSALSSKIAKLRGYEIIALHFSYGQRTQNRELRSFRKIAEDLGIVEKYELDLKNIFNEVGASALIDNSLNIPTGGIEQGIPITYVPFRNGIFLSIATALAEKHGATAIYIGVVEEDSSGYPDCRDSYISAMERAINLGTKDETNLTIEMPLVHMKKSEIVKRALELKVPLQYTWSCYQNGDRACGVCDSCRLRLKGFREAGVEDLIPYGE